MIPSTVRFDIIDETRDVPLFEKFVSKYDKYLIYKEVGTKTKKVHFQGIIWVPDKKAFNAMKTRFTNMFADTHPRSLKSMRQVESDMYEVYITKDGNLVYSEGYTDEEIANLEAKSYSKPVSVEKSNFFDKLYAYVLSKRHSYVNVFGDKEYDIMSIDEVARHCVSYFVEQSKVFDKSIIARFVTLIVMKMRPELQSDYANSISNMIL